MYPVVTIDPEADKRLRFEKMPFIELSKIRWLNSVDIPKQVSKSSEIHPDLVSFVDKSQGLIEDYNELCFLDYVNMRRKIDALCILSANRNKEKYSQCVEEADHMIHKQAAVPYVNSMVEMAKQANRCLLSKQSPEVCEDRIIENQMHLNQMFINKMSAIQKNFDRNCPHSKERQLLIKDPKNSKQENVQKK